MPAGALHRNTLAEGWLERRAYRFLIEAKLDERRGRGG
jgi:hypothetical protein